MAVLTIFECFSCILECAFDEGAQVMAFFEQRTTLRRNEQTNINTKQTLNKQVHCQLQIEIHQHY